MVDHYLSMHKVLGSIPSTSKSRREREGEKKGGKEGRGRKGGKKKERREEGGREGGSPSSLFWKMVLSVLV